MSEMFPLLAVALLIWAGVFGFIFVVDRKVRDLERRVNARLDIEQPTTRERITR